jgi:hypothetical protein
MVDILGIFRKVATGAAAGAGETFLRETEEGKTLVRSATQAALLKAAPWLLLGGVIVAFIILRWKRGRI